MTKKLNPIHPGVVLMEEFLKPLNLSQHRLALEIGVNARRIKKFVIRIGLSVQIQRYG